MVKKLTGEKKLVKVYFVNLPHSAHTSLLKILILMSKNILDICKMLKSMETPQMFYFKCNKLPIVRKMSFYRIFHEYTFSQLSSIESVATGKEKRFKIFF